MDGSLGMSVSLRGPFMITCWWGACKLGDNFSLWSYLRSSIPVSRTKNSDSFSPLTSIIRVFYNSNYFRFLSSEQIHVDLVRCRLSIFLQKSGSQLLVHLVGNTDEELCNRWMSLSAFTPLFRSHNIQSAISQEPYRWDSVAHASRVAIGIRYSLLPYWVSQKDVTAFGKH